jgi:hypothetical protein
MRALGATKPDTPHPNPVEQFLSTHPTAKEFLGSRTYPDSVAQATYGGINSLKFTNAKGHSVFVRYRFIPRAGEKYLTPDERKAKSASYLQDEIVQRIAKGPVVFDLVVQIAEKGDKVEDPSIAWPDRPQDGQARHLLVDEDHRRSAGRAEDALVPARSAASGRRTGRSHVGATQHRLSYLFWRATVETRAILWRHARARQPVWRRRRELQQRLRIGAMPDPHGMTSGTKPSRLRR